MWQFDDCIVPSVKTALPGPNAQELLERDQRHVSPSYTRIYPLVVEKIGARFPHYHPGFFNGIFSIALTGGMLAPATLGYASEIWGIQIVMLLPLFGSAIVVLLVLVIWLESKLISPKL